MELFNAILRAFIGPLQVTGVNIKDYKIYYFFEYYRFGMYSLTDFLTGMFLLYLFYRQGIALEQYELEENQKPSQYTPSYNTEHIRKILDKHHFSEYGSLRSQDIISSRYQFTKAPTRSL